MDKVTAELIAAAQLALEDDGGLRYLREEDEYGEHACCGETEFGPHAASCWVVRLRAAVKAAQA